MPVRCFNGMCFWDDEDVTGHAVNGAPDDLAAFAIGHADDPERGHLVRIRFDDPAAEQAFLARLERERPAAAS